MLREIWLGIIVQWKTDYGERPSGKELANLLGMQPTNVNRVLSEMGLNLKDFDD
jgi:hypothetical protein